MVEGNQKQSSVIVEGGSPQNLPEGVLDCLGLLAAYRKRPNLLIARSIDRTTLLKVRATIAQAQAQGQWGEIDLVLHSPGGDAHAGYALARHIRRSFHDAVAIVPAYAKSAATLMVLGMSEIMLGEMAELGPLDAQLREATDGDVPSQQSALNRFKALEHIQTHTIQCLDLAIRMLQPTGMKASELVHRATEFAAAVSDPLMRQVRPDKIGEAARSLDIGKEYAQRLLVRYGLVDDAAVQALVQRLVYGYPSHGFIIDIEELREIGLPATGAAAPVNTPVEALASLLTSHRGNLPVVFTWQPADSEPEGVSAVESCKSEAMIEDDAPVPTTPSADRIIEPKEVAVDQQVGSNGQVSTTSD